MKLNRIIVIVCLIIICETSVSSQTYIQPNIALKSHETLQISKVDLVEGKTVIYLSIENRIEGGTFCADKNIYIIYPDGTRLKIINSAGIPECPDTYKFKNIGERLAFTLTFPQLEPGIKWIDLIEDCNSNCFSIYGITLDNDLNKRVNEAFSYAEKGENYKAISILNNILDSIDNENAGIEGALYADLITLIFKTGDKTRAETLYKKMQLSIAPRLELYVKNLNSRGIKF